MAKARHAKSIQSKLGAILFGEPFSGKSTMASQLAYFKRPDGKPFRVLYIDPESGSIDDYLDSIAANGVDLDNIYIVYTQSLGEVTSYISKVKNHEDMYEIDDDGNETDEVVLDADGKPFRADAIVVDGTSILNLTTKQGLISFSKKRNKVKANKEGLIGEEKLVKVEGAGLELKDYQTINFKGQDLILNLMASGVHYVVTAREANEKMTVKTDDGKTTNVDTGRKIPDGFKGMDYNAKTVIHMFRNDNNEVCAEIRKDRTGIHTEGEVIEDPSLLDWQKVVDKNKGKEEFVLKNDLTKSVAVEQEIYKKEIMGELGEVTKEDVENVSEEDKSVNEVTSTRAEIKAYLAGLNPVSKAEAKKKIEDAKLPVAYTKVTDVKILKDILTAIKS